MDTMRKKAEQWRWQIQEQWLPDLSSCVEESGQESVATCYWQAMTPVNNDGTVNWDHMLLVVAIFLLFMSLVCCVMRVAYCILCCRCCRSGRRHGPSNTKR